MRRIGLDCPIWKSRKGGGPQPSQRTYEPYSITYNDPCIEAPLESQRLGGEKNRQRQYKARSVTEPDLARVKI